MTARDTALSFVDAINAQDIERLSGLMTNDHVFIDSDGSENVGRERMRRGWIAYFAMVPDYRIEVKDILAGRDTVAMLGFAEGAFDEKGDIKRENHWRVPAAWRAVVSGQQVAVWQLYVNPQPMLRILETMETAHHPHAADRGRSGDRQA